MFEDADESDDGLGDQLELSLDGGCRAGATCGATPTTKKAAQPIVTAARIGSIVVSQHGSLLAASSEAGDDNNSSEQAAQSVDNGGPAVGVNNDETSAHSSNTLNGNIGDFWSVRRSSSNAVGGCDDVEDFDDDDDYDEFDYDFDNGAEIGFRAGKDGAVTSSGGGTRGALQPREHALSGFYNKIRVEKYSGPQLADGVSNKIISAGKKVDASRIRKTDKSDRATTEQVLDPRTRMIVFKMLNRGVFTEVNGCISTGKEANVYHAICDGSSHELAIKIYKTSILVFKDRDRYVTGEFRFRRGYNKHNPRQMVKLWAEKEYRNLNRLRQAGVRCPETVLLRSHVLVMDFVGTDGVAAPKLKDALISERKARELYVSCVTIMRNMYQKAKLVHGDFSEYNILYSDGELVIIDVSQAVEHAHPHALEFLRTDITNVNDFFGTKGVPTMTRRELFDFVTDITLADDLVDERLDQIQQAVEYRLANPASAEAKREAELEEALFMKAFIPTSLDQVADMEGDIELLEQGKADNLYYTALTGLTAAHSGANDAHRDSMDTQSDGTVAGDGTERETLAKNSSEPNAVDSNGNSDNDNAGCGTAVAESDGFNDNSDDNDNGDGGEEDEEGDEWVERPGRVAETAEEKRARKQAVKEANRERRKHKTPKHVKKKQNNKFKRK
jgi:RIO kinase 1